MSRRHRFWEHIKAELEWATSCANEMDNALETLVSCLVRQQNIFRKLFVFLGCVGFCGVFFGFFWEGEAVLIEML